MAPSPEDPSSDGHVLAVSTSSAIVVVESEVLFKPPAVPAPPRRRRPLIAMVAGLLVVGAVVGVLVAHQRATSSASTTLAKVSSANGWSVCYDSYNNRDIAKHFSRIKERFSGVRTYQTQGVHNHIQAAAEAGLQIYAGIWIQTGDVEADMNAAVWGAQHYPGAIKAIMVGNEELLSGYGEQFVIDKVNRMKQKLHDVGIWNIKVGSVQTDGGWLNAWSLPNVVDVMGVNIHPFFGGSEISKFNPIDDLTARWNIMKQRFASKVVLTETGWPSQGSAINGHVPSYDMAKKYVSDVQNWAINGGGGGDLPAYFMFHDNPYKGQDFERAFGLANSNGDWKFDFSGDGSRNQPAGEIKGVVFVNGPYNYVLSVTSNRQVEFHPRWGGDWVYDEASFWAVRGPLLASWEANTHTDVCLDAWQPWNGGAVHVYPCDAGNANQQWNFDGTHLRHLTHKGFCLDMKYSTGGTPHLWSCLDVKLQQLQWWKV
ncbi:hypothetical protein AeNC1_014674 [Aphanomyces euteiches]|nr:hypothetical protein AeNC1_014674 [Aphanomyces euteiches]